MSRNRKFSIALTQMLTCVSAALAQVIRAEVDILSPGDEGLDGIPPNLLVIDVFVDIAATDAWTAAGVRVNARGGATLQYFDAEPNTPGHQPGAVNPGTANRFLTSLSRPRGRNANARFVNGAVGIAGSYDGGATPVLTPTQLNVAYFASPPVTSGSPSLDGWVARIAVDISQTSYELSDLVITHEQHVDAIVACTGASQPWGFVNATLDHPQLSGLSFWVIPEPATCAGLLILVGFSALQRRATTRTTGGS